MSDFQTLGLAPAITRSLEEAGLKDPTPIQAQAIPHALEGHDILGLAQTGTGKTLAFSLPMIHRLTEMPGKPAPKSVKALVLAPTRELVNQIAENLRPMVKHTRLRVTTVVGGQSISRQINTLARGIDILVATPGRLIDLMDRGAVDLSTVQFLVLDEADQMLDMGFIHALRRIAPQLGQPRQTMLFSATMPKQLESLSASYLTDPRRIQVAPPGKTADAVDQSVVFLPKAEKGAKLREILAAEPEALTLVFSRTKHGAERMKNQLVAEGVKADSVHGNKSQGQRDRAIKAFRAGTVTVLVATDVAARGIDIPGVSYVINYDLPNVPEAYVHRIGRTARAGRDGTAISFCSPDERPLLRDIERLIKRRFSDDAGHDDSQHAEAGAPKGKPKHRRGGQGKPRSAQGKPRGGQGDAGANRAGGKPGGRRRRSRSGGGTSSPAAA
ncbi:DEAD/DEAH box helicase [Poseidonocella sedimentorum]|uniref:ATP-dependent RNA helicase RhlE n=1 Tax=Poseidonocella sedimentorum TaxID=871652 RepID=A0A1I6DDJ8_9RHOB|nr:DEAD/DEAH box helicase [Poseidonocella sedimentorum]SFR03523.1 ATP-dependent RNA helicase RhlE [Poseidonocella sedimentorum]